MHCVICSVTIIYHWQWQMEIGIVHQMDVDSNVLLGLVSFRTPLKPPPSCTRTIAMHRFQSVTWKPPVTHSLLPPALRGSGLPHPLTPCTTFRYRYPGRPTTGPHCKIHIQCGRRVVVYTDQSQEQCQAVVCGHPRTRNKEAPFRPRVIQRTNNSQGRCRYEGKGDRHPGLVTVKSCWPGPSSRRGG